MKYKKLPKAERAARIARATDDTDELPIHGPYKMPNELTGIGDAIDWLEEYVNDAGEPQLADSVLDEARDRIAGLERALDYCVKKGLVRMEKCEGDKS